MCQLIHCKRAFATANSQQAQDMPLPPVLILRGEAECATECVVKGRAPKAEAGLPGGRNERAP